MSARQPKNLQDLLKFAIAHQQAPQEIPTDCENNDGPEPFQDMDEDRRAFLQNVLKAMTVDVMEEFLNAISILEDKSSKERDKCEALEMIRDYIDNLDFAINFVKIGGTKILLECVKDKNSPKVRSNAINVVAEMAQNNPFCQKHFMEDCKIIEILVLYLQEENCDYNVVACSLYALSAIIRGYGPAVLELIKIDSGLSCILECLDSTNSRVFIKSCFLVSSLSSEFPDVCDKLNRLHVFEMLARNLEIINDFDVKTETLLMAMATLSRGTMFQVDGSVKSKITEILNQIISSNENLPQCEEIVRYSKDILEKIV